VKFTTRSRYWQIDDHYREKRPRFAAEEDGRILGICGFVPEAHVGTSIPGASDAALRLDVVLVHPPEFRLMPEIMDMAQEQARKFGAGFEVVNDMEAAFKDADIIYAKSWEPWCTRRMLKKGQRSSRSTRAGLPMSENGACQA